MSSAAPQAEADIVTKLSPRPVAATVARFTELLAAKGVKVFAVIDQAAEARQAGLDLRETVLMIFGNPAAGTPVMAAAPLSALDLPLKILVWDDSGQTTVSYYAPAAIAARYQLPAGLAANLAAIGLLTDALVADR
jgi:uncharacterized protein (DUF302 family)